MGKLIKFPVKENEVDNIMEYLNEEYEKGNIDSMCLSVYLKDNTGMNIFTEPDEHLGYYTLLGMAKSLSDDISNVSYEE